MTVANNRAYEWLITNTELTPSAVGGIRVCRFESLSREKRSEYGVIVRFFNVFPRMTLEYSSSLKVLSRVAVHLDNGIDTGYRVTVVEDACAQPHST